MLRYAPRAAKDIADIHQYIARHNESAATAVVQRIRATSRLLARFPGLGQETDIPDRHSRGAGVSDLQISLSRLSPDRCNELIIIHVRDARRDAPRERDL
jgi:toxin ParE1/3/4